MSFRRINLKTPYTLIWPSWILESPLVALQRCKVHMRKWYFSVQQIFNRWLHSYFIFIYIPCCPLWGFQCRKLLSESQQQLVLNPRFVHMWNWNNDLKVSKLFCALFFFFVHSCLGPFWEVTVSRQKENQKNKMSTKKILSLSSLLYRNSKKKKVCDEKRKLLFF